MPSNFEFRNSKYRGRDQNWSTTKQEKGRNRNRTNEKFKLQWKEAQWRRRRRRKTKCFGGKQSSYALIELWPSQSSRIAHKSRTSLTGFQSSKLRLCFSLSLPFFFSFFFLSNLFIFYFYLLDILYWVLLFITRSPVLILSFLHFPLLFSHSSFFFLVRVFSFFIKKQMLNLFFYIYDWWLNMLIIKISCFICA